MFYNIIPVTLAFCALLICAPLAQAETLTIVVMDPLAKPLSCPCVEGYAQRDYEKLAEFLHERTGREFETVFSESLPELLRDKTDGRADVVIGKESVVNADIKSAGLALSPVAKLTGKHGTTSQTGLVVVRSSDSAQRIEDLTGYRILFGPEECDEKHSAAVRLLADANIALPDELETTEACSDGACKIIEWGDDERAAAVISSYAKPLLEGCGTIEKGDLRIVAETAPVPFITAFVSQSLDEQLQRELQTALLQVGENKDLRRSLESLRGFVAVDPDVDSAQAQRDEAQHETDEKKKKI